MTKEIYLAGGCFWGTEHFFKQIEGVVATEVGFANGHTTNPTYKEVYTDTTGFAETVRVVYDTERVGLRFLLRMFFKAIDPTSLNKQGHDEGTRYRTGIYYTDAGDLPVIEQVYQAEQAACGQPFAVEQQTLENFFTAEEYHQGYLDKNPDGYCHLPLSLFRFAKEAKPERDDEASPQVIEKGYRQMKIVILDGFTANPGDLSWGALEQMGELTVYDRTRPEETVERAKEADIVLTNKVCLQRTEIEQLPRLKYIGVLATGYNVVDIKAAEERGIVVTNVPAYSTMSVAQMVFAHLLTVTNRTEHYARQNREERWTSSPDFSYWDTELTELADKTLGIVGLGNIGTRVAAIAQAFGMRVVAYTSKDAGVLPQGIAKRTMDELLAESDVVSLHCPLTADTRHLICRETLQKMQPSAILINTGRGPLVNEQDVADALKEKRLKAYCADVLSEEPPRADSPLLHQENAYITPHIAWATKEARMRLIDVAIQNVTSFVGGHPQNVITTIP